MEKINQLTRSHPKQRYQKISRCFRTKTFVQGPILQALVKLFELREKYRFGFMLLVLSVIESKQQMPEVHFSKNVTYTVRTPVIILHGLHSYCLIVTFPQLSV